jgi:predicted GH43/DUF377 family glycosyl hydrolase
LTVSDWPYDAAAVFNPGAVRLDDGETLLLCRVEERTGFSHLTVARSKDGISDWRIEPQPSLERDAVNYPEECWGIEDPRIIYLPERNEYAIVYVCYGQHGPGVSIALTTDFRSYRRLGNVLPPEDKDAALFPRQFDGRWVMVHRPVCVEDAKQIWVSYSRDLEHWGERTLLLQASKGGWWDANKIGLSTPMLETPDGWLMIYHGVRQTVSGSIYRLGLALLALDDPSQCLLRSSQWFMGPDDRSERLGDVGNVVFPCGWTLADDGDTLRIYYGMADTCIGLAEGRVSELMDWLRRHNRSAQDGVL